MTEQAAIKARWSSALGQAVFFGALSIFWTLRWVVFPHPTRVPTHGERVFNLSLLAFALLLVPLPMLLLDRFFRKLQQRMILLGAGEADMALLAKSVGRVLMACYFALYFCVFALSAPR